MTTSLDPRRPPTLQMRARVLMAANFRPVANGYLYRAPNPWIFGRADHYIVSEAQRDAIIATLGPQTTEKSPILRLARCVVVGTAALGVVSLAMSLLMLLGKHVPLLNATIDITAGVAAAVIMVLVAATLISVHRLAAAQRAALQPILATATPSAERISNEEVLWGVRTGGGSVSTRRGFIISAAINAGFAATFLVAAYLGWQPAEGFISIALGAFLIAEAAIFALQAVFHGYCAKTDPLPHGAPKVEKAFKRTIFIGAFAFVGIALGYAGLLATGAIQPDLAAARARNERLAMAGDAEAMGRLAGQYRSGRGGPQDYAKARDWYAKAAEAGDASAMFWMGWLTQKGLGGARDLTLARQWFEKAAARGDGAAMTWLGADAQYGVWVTKDLGVARSWYEKAAAAGNSSGMNSLGVLYRDGLGVPKDFAAARSWFEKAAAAGSATSMNDLGVMYINGWGVNQDKGLARSWYEKAAAAGQPDGMQHLAILLDKGDGGSADPKRAADLLLRCAKLGHLVSRGLLLGPMSIASPATRTEIKRELEQLGHYHGEIDDTWNAEARSAVGSYLKSKQ